VQSQVIQPQVQVRAVLRHLATPPGAGWIMSKKVTGTYFYIWPNEVLLGTPLGSATSDRLDLGYEEASDLPAHSGHPQTPLDTSSQEWAFVDLALPQNANLLAPLLAAHPVRSFSNLASCLEPPYGIEP
jgi:hypothetical protein